MSENLRRVLQMNKKKTNVSMSNKDLDLSQFEYPS